MVELQKRLTFSGMKNGYSAILDAMETLGLNLTLVAKTIAHDMKHQLKEALNPILGKNPPQSVQELLDIAIPFFKTFGFEVEMNFSKKNLITCTMKGCLNKPLAEQSLAEGKEGCSMCMAAFMAAMTLSAIEVGEINQFRGKANANRCVFEIEMRNNRCVFEVEMQRDNCVLETKTKT